MNVKAIVIGSPCVGKTMFLNCIRNYRMKNGDYIPTIGVDFHIYRCLAPPVNIQIWDTSGSDRFKMVVESFLKGIDLCIFVYKDKRSFNSMMDLVADVQEKKRGKRFCVLSTGDSPDLGRQLATQYGYLFFQVDVRNEPECINTLNKIALFSHNEQQRTNFLEEKTLEIESEIIERFHCWFPFC